MAGITKEQARDKLISQIGAALDPQRVTHLQLTLRALTLCADCPRLYPNLTKEGKVTLPCGKGVKVVRNWQDSANSPFDPKCIKAR